MAWQVGLGEGARTVWLRTHRLDSSRLLAWLVNMSNATSVRGERVVLLGGGFDDGGLAPGPRGGDVVRVTLNGDVRPSADLLEGINVTYRFYPHGSEMRIKARSSRAWGRAVSLSEAAHCGRYALLMMVRSAACLLRRC